jgi:hypothetical protein
MFYSTCIFLSISQGRPHCQTGRKEEGRGGERGGERKKERQRGEKPEKRSVGGAEHKAPTRRVFF